MELMMPALIALLAFIVIVLFALLLSIKKVIGGLQKKITHLETEISRITDTFYGISAGAVGQGEHLAKVEKELDRLRSRLESIATNEQSGTNHSQAIKMAKRGATSQEIAVECEITKVEADLIVLLHGSN
ncbi:MAG: DUF2802 domain-containing protein [Gammaproteobacteria bacterium]|nr:MAG: DUF2802 domain-containing protein [Gammaproteobacteria bacterium]